VLAATLAMIPVLILLADVHSGGWRTFAFAANWVIWAVFAIEAVVILAVASRKKAALRAHTGWTWRSWSSLSLRTVGCFPRSGSCASSA
jgi:hypothetical protein